ncbi:ABC transporter substrate-binding protein [Nakamurella sp. YIM 132087]|uniref:ABC transporter substrate-binding protein n=2 Tax=Nakamurella alba TaxID=2665158 RepID=A0A7K1FMC8_9ACTN|nr:ABC transporter substrate-binding protein [Nakamurella alba]
MRAAGLSAAAGVLAACGSDETPATTSSSAATTAGSSAGTSTSASAETSMSSATSEGTASATGSATGGAGPSVAPGTYGTIALQLSWIKNIEFAGEFFADSKGYYTQAGFEKVDLVSGPVDSADALVFANSVDIGLSAPDATARLVSEQGAPLKIIGSTFQKNPFCILSLEEGKPIRTPEDLKGKKIGIQTGTNQSIFAGFLSANGIDASELEQVAVGFEPTPLTAGEVDGFMAYLTNEPFIVKADGKTPVTLSFADNGLPLTAETFTVTEETITSKRDMLKAFLWAEIKGWNDAVADPAGSAKLAVETYGSDLGLDIPGQTEQAEAQNTLVVSDETKTNGLFTISDTLMGQIGEALVAVGITDVTTDQLFDLSLLEEVYAEYPDLIVG